MARVLAVLLACAVACAAVPISDWGHTCKERLNCGEGASLACIDDVCQFCATNDDCGSNMVCHKLDTTVTLKPAGSNVSVTFQETECVRKNLFPLSAYDWLATFAVFIAGALAAGGGIGGGGLMVPLFIVVGQFDPKTAIPLSAATIFGGSLANLAFFLRRKHPLAKHRPVIDFNLATVMECTTILGTLIGVLLHHIFPNWLIVALLIVLLGVTAYRTFQNAAKKLKQENDKEKDVIKKALVGRPGGGGHGRRWSIFPRLAPEAIAKSWRKKAHSKAFRNRLRAEDRADMADIELDDTPTKGASPSPDAELGVRLLPVENDESVVQSDEVFTSEEKASMRAAMKRDESSICWWKPVLIMGACETVVTITSVLRGGESGSMIGIACGSGVWWVLFLINFPFLVIVTWRFGEYLRKENKKKFLIEYDYKDGDVHWTKMRTRRYPTICTVAGVMAGLLGIGGGMVKGPLMIEMGVQPPVQASTAAFMIMFTASATIVQFAAVSAYPGLLQIDYIFWFIAVGFICSIFGQYGLEGIIKKTRRTSYIVYLVAIILTLSVVLMGVVGIIDVVKNAKDGVGMGFKGVC